ncbi:MAG: SDR family oxidoreductase [Bryobacterales bacterium]|nr:SDR family oxidoreductase [Bryobacterales bacterium]
MTTLVTGASSGIGAAIALGLASCGARVLVHYNSNLDGAREVACQIQARGGEAELFPGDLSCADGVCKFTEKIQALGRPVDILVNNAGTLLRRARILEVSGELWDDVITLNLKSAFFISQTVVPGMMERGQGCIVNISSLAAMMGGGIGASVYATAKGGLSTLTKAFAREFAPHGIRINAVSPGTIDTNYHRRFNTKEGLESVRVATPAGRIGTSSEVADVVLFLCSDAARFVHGQVVEVNGGYWLA